MSSQVIEATAGSAELEQLCRTLARKPERRPGGWRLAMGSTKNDWLSRSAEALRSRSAEILEANARDVAERQAWD